MTFVLDASAAIAAARKVEPGHARARGIVDSVMRGEHAVVVPAMFGIEVVASLARRGHDLVAAEAYVGALLSPPAETVTIGPVRARKIDRLPATRTRVLHARR